jgi:hypothetical protein
MHATIREARLGGLEILLPMDATPDCGPRFPIDPTHELKRGSSRGVLEGSSSVSRDSRIQLGAPSTSTLYFGAFNFRIQGLLVLQARVNWPKLQLG